MNPSLYESLERRARPGWGRVGRSISALWKLAAGTALASSWLGAVVAAGWTSRFMQRTAMKAWWQGQPRPFRKMLGFREVAARTGGLEAYAAWPHWIVDQNAFQALKRGRIAAIVGGLWKNSMAGVGEVLASTAVLAGPVALLTLAWHWGWRLAPTDKALPVAVQLLGAAGAVGHACTLFYLPMAQARAAVTGEWRTFFDFRLIRRAIRRRWFACTVLAIGWAVGAALAANLLKATPDAKNRLDGAETLGCAFVFIQFVALRWLAARIYASAILQMLNDREIRLADLAPNERIAFPETEVTAEADADTWTGRERFWAWTRSFPARTLFGAVVFAAGTAVVASQTSLARRLGRWPWQGWHPVTQAPHFPSGPRPPDAP